MVENPHMFKGKLKKMGSYRNNEGLPHGRKNDGGNAIGENMDKDLDEIARLENIFAQFYNEERVKGG